MSAFLFALVAVTLTSFGGRDQLLIAGLSARQGPRLGIFITGSIIAIITAAAVVLSSQYILMLVPSVSRLMVPFALFAAAIELAWPVKMGKPLEPTHSLGAAAIVFLISQIADGSRLLIVAIAVSTGVPWLAGAGGALGGILAVAIGWTMAEDLMTILWLKFIRRMLAAIVLLFAIYAELSARGIVS